MSLKLHQLAFRQGRFVPPHPLTATVEPGQLVAVLGANGCGKSTLLKGLAGLLPPAQGNAECFGKAWLDLDSAGRVQEMAYLPQQAECHWPLLSERVVALGITAQLGANAASRASPESSAAAATRQTRIREALALCDALHLRGRPFNQLSGGEQRRILMARALAMRPRLLLADEALNGLDPLHQIQLMQTLSDWARPDNIGLLVLHDINLALRFCGSTILFRQDGVSFGPTAGLLSDDGLAAAFQIQAQRVSVDGQTYLLHWEERQ